ncbi:MAG: hypothetical protein JSV16_16545 [Candidatus Hydrogenedentota bacterium]|nr:MAG: hypothetical protein JSV16_16545 [Candidatus Hydrogenedentota bacterium]
MEAQACIDTMDVFDDSIKEIREWFWEKKREGKARQYRVPVSTGGLRPPCRNSYRVKTDPEIVLGEDTHLELGHPSVGSCSVTLATRDPSLVDNGRVTLVGLDIPETDRKKLPFAQIAIACCGADIEGMSLMMDRVLHASAQIDGYMLRSVPNLIWGRVSKEAARSGFSMRQLGLRLIDSLNSECEGISGSEIFFVTSSREDIRALERIVDKARNKLRKLQTYNRKPDGTYECTTALDCTECPEKPVCDNIREVIRIRKGDRIITLEDDAGSEAK